MAFVASRTILWEPRHFKTRRLFNLHKPKRQDIIVLMKQCKTCGKNKEYSYYYQNSKRGNSWYPNCKVCHVAITIAKRSRRKSDEHTKVDVLANRWRGIISRPRYKGYENVRVKMTRQEFISHMDNTELDRLYNHWIENKRQFRLTPSVDRVDPEGHYEVGNIRWVTVSENAKRARRKGVHRKKAIKQYTRAGKYLRTFNSVTDAAREVKGSVANISNNAKGKIPSAYGHTWKYAVSPEYPNH